MKKFFWLFNFVLLTYITMAQSGPGGVGTSANNVAWFKGDAGTSTTIDGSAVSGWNDQSGNGVNLTQTTAARQPLFRASLMNSMPAVEFDNNTTNNDFLTAPDNVILDNTAGYSIFTVTRMKNLGGDARCIVSKRTAIDTDEAFMFFYYTSNHVYLDIDGLGDRFSTAPTTYTTGTNYILDAIYDGSLAMANRSKIYEGETLRKTSAENSSLVGDKPSPLLVGATHSADNRPFAGYVSEVIIYRVTLNDACRIIVNNYLSAKYDIALAANDKYQGDNSANGHMDRQVGGVGQEASGNNTTFNPSVTGGMGITATAGLNDGDYLMAGHNIITNTATASDVAVVSGGPIDVRWKRIWYIDVTNTGAAVTTNLTFDFSDAGITGVTPSTASNYKLLYRSGITGPWTIVATATSVAGDQVIFSGYNFASNTNDGHYTIGTLNNNISPLPIQLLSFNAVLNDDAVDVYWATASETNNHFFSVERSKDGELWAEVARVNGAGQSNQLIEYADRDNNPLAGVSYYRLKQTDYDGHFTYSNVVVVKNNKKQQGDFTLYPNPSEGNYINMNFSGFGDEDVLVVIRDIQGKEHYSRVHTLMDKGQVVAVDLEDRLPAGTYLVVASSEEMLISKKLVVKK